MSSSTSSTCPLVFNINKTGVAIHGYDCVAYFTKSKAVKGSAEHATQHGNATFWFESAEHKALFDAEPAKFMPQYGGWCAFAASGGNTADVAPSNSWKIIDDKLYLNNNPVIQKLWMEKKQIKKADEKWHDLARKMDVKHQKKHAKQKRAGEDDNAQ